MSSALYVYQATDEDPAIALEWLDRDGDPLDLSTATFTAVLRDRITRAATVTKTSNITGAATLPNVIIAWGAGELASCDGTYELVVTAVTGGRQRTFRPDSLPLVKVIG